MNVALAEFLVLNCILVSDLAGLSQDRLTPNFFKTAGRMQ